MKRIVIAGTRRLEYTLIQSVRRNVLFQALPESGIRVYAPRGMRLRDIDAMVRQRAALRSALSARALLRIRQRIEHYAPLLGVQPGRVTVRDQKSRWGSCSSKHNLNFNWKLIMAPPQALDYVVVHELCHLKIFNHSPRFWALVGSCMPDYEVWKKWLKVHGADLFL